MFRTNTINKKIFDFTCSSEILAKQMQHELVHYTSPDLDSIIDEILTAEFNEHEHLIIDKIEIDLGNVDIKDFGNDEMLHNFKQFLKERITLSRSKEEAKKDDSKLSFSDADLQITKAFLLHGSFPWWMSTNTPVNLDEILQKLISDQPDALKSFLLRHGSTPAVISRLTEHYKTATKSALNILVPGLIDQPYKKQVFNTFEKRIDVKKFPVRIFKKLTSAVNKKNNFFYKEYKLSQLVKLIKRPYFKWENELKILDILSFEELKNLYHFFYSGKKQYKNKRQEVINSLNKLSVFQIEFLLHCQSFFTEEESASTDKFSYKIRPNKDLNFDNKINNADNKTSLLNRDMPVIKAETISFKGEISPLEKTEGNKNTGVKTGKNLKEPDTDNSADNNKSRSNQNNSSVTENFINKSSTLISTGENESNNSKKLVADKKPNIKDTENNNNKIIIDNSNVDKTFTDKSLLLKTTQKNKSNGKQHSHRVADVDTTKSFDGKSQTGKKDNDVNNINENQPKIRNFYNEGQANYNNNNKVNDAAVDEHINRPFNNKSHLIKNNKNINKASEDPKINSSLENKSQSNRNNNINKNSTGQQINSYSKNNSQAIQNDEKINTTSLNQPVNTSYNNESQQNQSNNKVSNVSVHRPLILQEQFSVPGTKKVNNVFKETVINNYENKVKPGKNKNKTSNKHFGKQHTFKNESLVEKIDNSETTNQRNLDEEKIADLNFRKEKIEKDTRDEPIEKPIPGKKSNKKDFDKINNNDDYKRDSRISYIQKKIGKFNQVLKNELNVLSDRDLLQLDTRFKQFEHTLKKRKKALKVILEHPYLFTYNLLELFASSNFAPPKHIDAGETKVDHNKAKRASSSAFFIRLQSAQSGLIDTINNLPANEALVLQDVLKKESFETENEKIIVARVFKKLPEATIGLLHFFTQLSEEEMQEFSSSFTKELSGVNKKRLNLDNPVYYHDEPEKIHIENAGLCIIATYFLPLFNNLSYLENRIFKNKAIAIRALFLIQYIVSCKSKSPEYLLQFNKLLCGFHVQENITANIRLTKKERLEADDLLRSVIENWETIKNTSLNGFRESFLRRRGILTENEFSWTLQVERKGHDMLLSTIPWGFGIIKLPWMKKHIQVEW